MQCYSQLWSWQTVLQDPCESRAAGEAGQPQGLSVTGKGHGTNSLSENIHCNPCLSCPKNTKCFT